MIRRTITADVPVDAIPTGDNVIEGITQALQNKTPLLVTFVNPSTTVLVRRDGAAAVFQQFDVVAPDGIAMAMAVRWLHGLPAARLSFDSTSLAPAVFQLAVPEHRTMVLCGGRPGVADQAKRQLEAAFPGLNIIATFHGYSDPATLVKDICQLSPDFVICGMGGLRQEQFLLTLRAGGWRGIGLTCGGYLDQLSQGMQYYPKLIDSLQLRWAYRLYREPRRLWRRYLLDYPIFATSVVKALLSSSRANER